MRHWFLFLFLLVITDPYEGIDYEAINVYDLRDNKSYSIKVYGPELGDDSHEVEFNENETQRFIKKVNRIINYSPYVYLNSQVIDTTD